MHYDIYLGCFEDFWRVYAGLLVDGSMMRSLLIEGLNENKQWKRLARRMDESLVLKRRREIFWLDANAISNRSNFGFGSNHEKERLGRRGTDATNGHPTSIMYT